MCLNDQGVAKVNPLVGKTRVANQKIRRWRRLTSLRSTLRETQTTVEEFRKFAAKIDDGALSEERTSHTVRLVTRVIVTISEIDNHLEELANRLFELQGSAGQLKVTASNYIVGATSLPSCSSPGWRLAKSPCACTAGRAAGGVENASWVLLALLNYHQHNARRPAPADRGQILSRDQHASPSRVRNPRLPGLGRQR
jgi:hypothetical protein